MSAGGATDAASVGRRVRAGVRRAEAWLQLVRFATVGASGYVVNLAVFWLCTHQAGLDYRLAAVAAFAVAVSNNFVWNRRWTFDARDGHAGRQGARFLTVSLVALACNLALLELLVGTVGMPALPAQALAVGAATPIGFVGHRLWTFGAGRGGRVDAAA